MSSISHSAIVAAALLLVSCATGSAPTPTPRSVVNVLEGLALRGATVREAISGDTGCPSVPLHGNAVRLVVTLDASDDRHDIYLFRWRRTPQYEVAAEEFAQCVEEFERRGTEPVEVVEMEPWRAFGRGWSSEVRSMLDDSLRAAGGG